MDFSHRLAAKATVLWSDPAVKEATTYVSDLVRSVTDLVPPTLVQFGVQCLAGSVVSHALDMGHVDTVELFDDLPSFVDVAAQAANLPSLIQGLPPDMNLVDKMTDVIGAVINEATGLDVIQKEDQAEQDLEQAEAALDTQHAEQRAQQEAETRDRRENLETKYAESPDQQDYLDRFDAASMAATDALLARQAAERQEMLEPLALEILRRD